MDAGTQDTGELVTVWSIPFLLCYQQKATSFLSIIESGQYWNTRMMYP